MIGRDILVINEQNLINAHCLDFKAAFDITKDALFAYSKGNILYPDKVSQIFNEDTQDRINCLPATLLHKNICGVKWVSVFPSNRERGLQNLSAIILLSSTQTGFPLAFLEGTMCSNLRTATVSTVAADYLAKKNPKSIGFIGAGQQARFHLRALMCRFPSIKTCFVSSRTDKSVASFIDELQPLFPGLTFVPCDSDYRKAVETADIIVSAISGQEPLLKAQWIQKGTLYLHVGGWEDEYDVALSADKIVCDHWESVKHRTQTVSRLYKAGLISDDDIYCDLDALVSGNKRGRENDSEFIYFNAVGLSYVDVALATHFYETCLKANEGARVPLCSE